MKIVGWFNQLGFYHENGEVKGCTLYQYNVKDKEYDVSWYILMKLMFDIVVNSSDLSKPITIFSDSRIIEEVQGKAPTLTEYAKSILKTIRRDLLPQAIFIFKKCSREEINKKLEYGQTDVRKALG